MKLVNISANCDIKKIKISQSNLIKHITREARSYKNINVSPSKDTVYGMGYDEIKSYTQDSINNCKGYQKSMKELWLFVVKLNPQEINGGRNPDLTTQHLDNARNTYSNLITDKFPNHKILTIAEHHEKGVDLHFIVSAFNERSCTFTSRQELTRTSLFEFKRNERRMLNNLGGYKWVDNQKQGPVFKDINKYKVYKEQYKKQIKDMENAFALNDFELAKQKFQVLLQNINNDDLDNEIAKQKSIKYT